jgi:hypothetical protein
VEGFDGIWGAEIAMALLGDNVSNDSHQIQRYISIGNEWTVLGLILLSCFDCEDWYWDGWGRG